MGIMEEDADISAFKSVELAQMKQQTEARCLDEDWTGLSDAAARRKLQNRLNQRIYRRKRGAKSTLSNRNHGSIAIISSRGESQSINKPDSSCGRVSTITSRNKDGFGWPVVATTQRASVNVNSRYACTNRIQREQAMLRLERMIQGDYLLGSPRTDHLITLIQFNVFRALLSNTNAMGWNFEWLECTDPVSPWNTLPVDSEPSCPQALRPTLVQRKIKHHPWIDLWPIPKMRDNLLLADGLYDEDQLCNDLVEFFDVSNEQTGLIVWREPWDPAGWEVSETLVKKWGWIVTGCAELLHSTNYWRAQRGEKPLVFEV